MEKMNIKELNKKALEIKKASQDGAQIDEVRFSGLVLVKNCNAGTTSTGNPKFSGIIANEDEAQFNVWNNSSAYDAILAAKIIPGETIACVSGNVSRFGVVINSFEVVEDSSYTPDEFLYHRYNLEELKKDFDATVTACGISPVGANLLNSILHRGQNDKVEERFFNEFAALNHHDNCKHGLLAHTVKCLKIYSGLRGTYPFLLDQRTNDLMVIGLAIHDLGKIQELKNGTYQKHSYVSHRILGTERLFAYRREIIEAYDKDFYYMLLSVIEQHHDEYGDKACTVYALIAHMIDNMDATFSSLGEMIEAEAYTVDASGAKLKLGDRYLNIFE